MESPLLSDLVSPLPSEEDELLSDDELEELFEFDEEVEPPVAVEPLADDDDAELLAADDAELLAAADDAELLAADDAAADAADDAAADAAWVAA